MPTFIIPDQTMNGAEPPAERGHAHGLREGKERIFYTWLKDELGLVFDPFEILDAGEDPDLPSYLVDHGAFAALWGDWPSFVFASAGGGKTAFRVRLARACRVDEDGRRIFPIVFRVPSPADVGGIPPNEERYFDFINQAIAVELLLELAYFPDSFISLSAQIKQTLVCLLEQNLPGSLSHFLAQLEHFGILDPLVEIHDRTATRLPSTPSAKSIRAFCAALREITYVAARPESALARFDRLLRLLAISLGYESVYLLIDGVDAHVEPQQSTAAAIELLRPILTRARAWSDRRLFPKFFLPIELKAPLETVFPTFLTSPTKVAMIEWTKEALVEVLRERLRVASEGMFNSLDAISDPGLRDAELELVETARPSPREVVVLAERLLYEHWRRVGPRGKLDQQDLSAACQWYVGS